MGYGGPGPEADALREYALGLKATSVHVEPDGLRVALTGGPSAPTGA